MYVCTYLWLLGAVIMTFSKHVSYHTHYALLGHSDLPGRLDIAVVDEQIVHRGKKLTWPS